jgi:hypothetical protein
MTKLQKTLIAAVFTTAILYLCVHPGHGTARNGKVEDNKYYLGSHGNYWEVSRQRFIVCNTMEYVAPVTLVLSFGLLWFLRPKENKTSD